MTLAAAALPRALRSPDLPASAVVEAGRQGGAAVAAVRLRIATYDARFSGDGPGLLLRTLRRGDDPRIRAAVATIVQAAPDVILLTRIDYDHGMLALDALGARLAAAGRAFPYRLAFRPNAGVPSGFDLDGDGRRGGAGDALGRGDFAGQGGMAILSRVPIDRARSRDLSALPWHALPGSLVTDAALEPDARARLPLSSNGHWNVALDLPGGRRLRLLAFSATAPVGGRGAALNVRRNHDEVAFWRAYLDGRLPLEPPSDPWVILGNANLDPVDGAGRHQAIAALLADPRLQDPLPVSAGARAAAAAAVNRDHRGDLARATAFWDRPQGPGSLRLDYVLPSRALGLRGAGVWWPAPGTPAGDRAALASVHRLVWADVTLP